MGVPDSCGTKEKWRVTIACGLSQAKFSFTGRFIFDASHIHVDELIDRVGKANFITTLDLTTGYWQIPMADKDKCKTAFVTPFGSFQFTVCRLGLAGPQRHFSGLWIDCCRDVKIML